jgi:hypothetical protein
MGSPDAYRGPRAGRAHGAGATRGISIAAGGSGVAGTEDRLRSSHALLMDAQKRDRQLTTQDVDL